MSTGKWRGRTLQGKGTDRTKADSGHRELHRVSLWGAWDLFRVLGEVGWAARPEPLRPCLGVWISSCSFGEPLPGVVGLGGATLASMYMLPAHPYNVSRTEGQTVLFAVAPAENERTSGVYAW